MTVGVAFLATIAPHGAGAIPTIGNGLTGLADDGWSLDLRAGTGAARRTPIVYYAEPYQSIGVFGIFEAPSLPEAVDGIHRLEASDWNRAFDTTQWLVGPRDHPPRRSDLGTAKELGFLALWDWNDAWHSATAAQRSAYDAECDVAFDHDIDIGCDILGRFDTSARSGWDHVALWEVPGLDTLTDAMDGHEVQRDFMYTTSSHYIGRRMTLDEFGGIAS